MICGFTNPKLSDQQRESTGLVREVCETPKASCENPRLSQQCLHAELLYLALVPHSECPEMFYVVVVFHCSEEGNMVIKTHHTCRLVCDTKLNRVLRGSEREEFMQGLYWNLVLGSCCCFAWK